MRVPQLAPPLAAAALLVLGCSSQVAPDYEGEPLATVQGTVKTTTDAGPTGEIDAAIVWADWASRTETEPNTDTPGLPIARVQVDGDFPASFTLDILTPPPMDSEYGIGLIAAVSSDASESITSEQLLGVSLDTFVVYFARDADDSPLDAVAFYSQFYNVPPTRGFHLVRTMITEESERDSFRCQYPFLCEHVVWNDPENNANFDEEFELCTKYVPEAPTCTRKSAAGGIPLTSEEEQENARCEELRYQASLKWEALPEDERQCAPPWFYPGNPEGFDYAVTVTLGATFDDWAIPRASNY